METNLPIITVTVPVNIVIRLHMHGYYAKLAWNHNNSPAVSWYVAFDSMEEAVIFKLTYL